MPTPAPQHKTEQLSTSQRLLLALRKSRTQIEAMKRQGISSEPIAIIGMGCRFPGADNPEAFWQLLREGRDMVGEIPPDRWNTAAYYDADPEKRGKIYIRSGAFLDLVDQFDPLFFGISPREANSLDPQQRLLLEVSWEALENAGQAPSELVGSQTGVFLGIGQNDYAQLQLNAGDPERIDVYDGTGNLFCFASGRLSYTLGLQGPNMALDTACSSSLVAIHLACQSLRLGESKLALAGGVHLILEPTVTVFLSRTQALAPDGRCKTFDAAADGYGRGEGCGMLVLKRLSDAQADGDNILALIRGSAINHDGPSSGLTVPNKLAQEALIRRALANANVKPHQIDYIEAHGTGTSLGDPIEVRALAAVLGERQTPLMLGAVKTNIGHLEPAAGVAGIIKVVQMMQHQEIPPHLHLKTPSNNLNWDDLPVTIPTEVTPWRGGLAGISSFGMSGTNAHIILDTLPAVAAKLEKAILPEGQERDGALLTLSAKTKESLMALVSCYSDYLSSEPNAAWADICFTSNIGRSHFKHRLSIAAHSVEEGKEKIETVLNEQVLSRPNNQRGKVAFLFTGQGSQYSGMGRQLYESNAIFRQTLERCDEILRPYLSSGQPQGLSLLSILYPTNQHSQGKPWTPSDAIHQTAYTQPALFALEYALAQVWLSWGIRPDVVMGHSVGEVVAACVAGVFSLEDGLKLIAERGRLMQALPAGGEMVAVWASEAVVTPLIAPYTGAGEFATACSLSIAAINGPESVVLSGSQHAVEAVVERLTEQEIRCKKLEVSHAFHSPLMEPMLSPFMRVAEEINYTSPHIKIISNVTGQLVRQKVATASYWVDHVRQPVRFTDAMQRLSDMGINTFIELGPRPVLLGMARQGQAGEQKALNSLWLPSLRPGRHDWQQLLESLGQLYEHGAKIDWRGFYNEELNVRQRVHLPTYQWQRERYWLDLPPRQSTIRNPQSTIYHRSSQIHPLLHERVELPVKQRFFSSQLSANQPAYLTDHRVLGQVIFPAAAYLEMALTAGAEVLKGEVELSDVLIQQAMILPAEGEALSVKMVLTPDKNNGTASFDIYTLAQPAFNDTQKARSTDESWITHASGKISLQRPVKNDKFAPLSPGSFAAWQSLSSEAYYQSLREEQGFDYGSTFQVIRQLWVEENTQRAGSQARAKVRLPAGLTLEDYHFHPILLDAGLQLLCAIVPHASRGQTYLPVGLDTLQLYRQPKRELSIEAQVDESQATSETLTAQLDFFDDEGLIAQIRGLSLRGVEQELTAFGIEKDIRGATSALDLLYEIKWQRLPCTLEPLSLAGDWLIFADRGGIGEELAHILVERGNREELPLHAQLVYRGGSYRRLGVDNVQINPAEPFDFLQLFIDTEREWQGIIYLWNLDLQEEAPLAGCGAPLHLIQALHEIAESHDTHVGGRLTPALWLVTRGSQAVGESVQQVDPWQAPLWGLGKVITLEHPELHPVCLDLAPLSNNSHENDHEAQLLFDELSHRLHKSVPYHDETQIAYRENIRYVARLERYEGERGNDTYNNEATGEFAVKLRRYGLLDDLYFAPYLSSEVGLSRKVLGAGEVEIEVRATGLNFRDVLRALGMLQKVEGAIGIHSVEDAWFGLECAGVISRVGADAAAAGLEVGDEVIAALAKGSLGSFVTVKAEFVIPKPKGLTDEEGATIPIAFLTAYYGLYELAMLQAGERVLIHSAAGGVGQAAVQLAQLAGAEIFATASPTKWEFLQSMGIEHIMNSRTLDFAGEIMDLTGGQGVDVILNSLNGDFIDKSFAVLGNKGRFIELGKIGIWDEEQVGERRPDIEYSAFDLGEIAEETPALIASMLDKLHSLFTRRADGELHNSLKPLPLKSFPIGNVVDAFRYMAQAKHIGKVVTTFPPTSTPIRSNACYLITGGLGALGLELADWLVEQGAEYLVLMGRSKPSKAAESRLEFFMRQRAGVKIQVMAADVTDRRQMSALLAEIKQTLPPLRGVIHAAGLLDDGILVEQNKERFERVMAPKVQGSWNLHLLTQEQELDFFVLFSSAAAFVGSAGQGNYAAANSFMDGLAHYRRAQGLPALSINWGPWAKAGMATSEQVSRRLAAQGWGLITPEVGLKVFEELLKQGDASHVAELGVLPINWPQFLAQRAPSPLFEAFTALESPMGASPASREAKPELMTQLSLAPLGERRELLDTYVRDCLGHVLGIHTKRTAQIEDRERLFDLGLDSLTAVELRRRLEAGLECSLRSTLLFHYPTIEALVDHLAEEVLAEYFRDEASDSVEEAEYPEGTLPLLDDLLYNEQSIFPEISDAAEDDEESSLDDIAQLLAANLGIEVG